MPAPYPSGDPVPAITEAEATGEIADTYRDIRAMLGVPVVNLIWRHLATMPGALPWTWASVRPLYASGAVAQSAAHLRETLDIPSLPPWPISALECLGLSVNDRAGIARVLASYDRSNALNLMALGALRAHARGEAEAAPLPVSLPDAEIEGELPTLLTFEQMAPATADLVRRLNAVGDAEHRVVASMYRHLSHWPAFLALIWERLAPLAGDGRIDAIIAQNLEIAHVLSRRLASQIQDGAPSQNPPPSPETTAEIHAALDLFIRYAIGRMVPIGRMLAAGFPKPDAGD